MLCLCNISLHIKVISLNPQRDSPPTLRLLLSGGFSSLEPGAEARLRWFKSSRLHKHLSTYIYFLTSYNHLPAPGGFFIPLHLTLPSGPPSQFGLLLGARAIFPLKKQKQTLPGLLGPCLPLDFVHLPTVQQRVHRLVQGPWGALAPAHPHLLSLMEAPLPSGHPPTSWSNSATACVCESPPLCFCSNAAVSPGLAPSTALGRMSHHHPRGDVWDLRASPLLQHKPPWVSGALSSELSTCLPLTTCIWELHRGQTRVYSSLHYLTSKPNVFKGFLKWN